MGDKLNRTANDLFAFYLAHLNGEEAEKSLDQERWTAVKAKARL